MSERVRLLVDPLGGGVLVALDSLAGRLARDLTAGQISGRTGTRGRSPEQRCRFRRNRGLDSEIGSGFKERGEGRGLQEGESHLQTLAPVTMQKSPRMVPGAESWGLV
jgi:hypothetical protein